MGSSCILFNWNGYWCIYDETLGKMKNIFFLLLVIAGLASCTSSDDKKDTSGEEKKINVVFIIADDLNGQAYT